MPSEETIQQRTESETKEMQAQWTSKTIAEHIMLIKGAEIVYFEFKEILFDMARKLKHQIDPKTGKITVVLRKFIEEWLLTRLTSYVRFKIPIQPAKGKEATRVWPESDKDVVIREKRAQMKADQEARRLA